MGDKTSWESYEAHAATGLADVSVLYVLLLTYLNKNCLLTADSRLGICIVGYKQKGTKYPLGRGLDGDYNELHREAKAPAAAQHTHWTQFRSPEDTSAGPAPGAPLAAPDQGPAMPGHRVITRGGLFYYQIK